jgi:LacI family transcriptional regulator
MNITIKDVAEKAGVSIATVSRVFNNSDQVTQRTIDLVRKIARELNYFPNASARSLIRKKSDTFGMILPDMYGEFFSELIRGADKTAQKNSYNLLLSSSHNNHEEIVEALNVMKGRVDGIVMMSPLIDAHMLHENLPKTLPIILLHCDVQDNAFDSITIDNYSSALRIVKHLINHGHERIAIIKGARGNYESAQRLRGYRDALTRAGYSVNPSYELDGEFSEESAYDAIRKLLVSKVLPTAVFASNDSMAIGALRAFHDNGITVPDDIALVGFDDIPISRYIKPSLTTVHVPINEMGVLAIERLMNAVEEKNSITKEQIVFPTQISIRESCGCGM